jgi:hypothetical protein
LQTLKEHDYGSGAPGSILRTTSYTYLSTTPYQNAHILNRVTEKTIADSLPSVFNVFNNFGESASRSK